MVVSIRRLVSYERIQEKKGTMNNDNRNIKVVNLGGRKYTINTQWFE